MNLFQAIAVFLYLQHRIDPQRTAGEEKALAEAWGVICQYAERVVRRKAE